jgi:hypothetical protein
MVLATENLIENFGIRCGISGQELISFTSHSTPNYASIVRGSQTTPAESFNL